jgi:hypothetical protein
VARAVDELAREIDELRAGLVGDRARA